MTGAQQLATGLMVMLAAAGAFYNRLILLEIVDRCQLATYVTSVGCDNRERTLISL